jgi:hypothetical protein
MPAFLEELKAKAPKMYETLVNAGGAKGAKTGSKEFMDAWRDLADKNPQRFVDIQHSFIRDTHYEPVAQKVNAIKGLDLSRRSAAIKEVIWSTAVQHGGTASEIFQRALKGQDVAKLTDEAIVRAVYQERSRVEVYFKKLSQVDREKMRLRFSKELQDVLKLIKATVRPTNRLTDTVFT